MTESLGKLEKPPVENFAGKRKLYLIPLIFSESGAPPEYLEKFNLYWGQVSEHVANLESKIGKVRYVFHESVSLPGEDGLKAAEKLSPASGQIARDRCQGGAVFEATEDEGLIEESLDWERCLLTGFASQKVAKMVSEFYLEDYRKRSEYISRRIDESIKGGEVGLLFIREGHMVQFPQDMEVFNVAPPVLDEIHRWWRQRSALDNESVK